MESGSFESRVTALDDIPAAWPALQGTVVCTLPKAADCASASWARKIIILPSHTDE